MCQPGPHSLFTSLARPAVLNASISRPGFIFLMWVGLCLGGAEHAHSLAAPTPKPPAPAAVAKELSMAKTKALYMVIDLPHHQAVLKARGIVLRTFPLHEIDWIGDPIPQSSSFHLTTKDPMISPLSISPPPASDKTAEAKSEEDQSANVPPPKAQTVSDMPLRYELVFDGRMVVIVQPHHLPSFWDNAFQQMANWTGRVTANVSTWKEAFGQPSEPYLVLSMEPIDAQAFYWAVLPPMPWLVFP